MRFIRASALCLLLIIWLWASSRLASEGSTQPATDPGRVNVRDRFYEVTAQAGIHFQHINGATPEKYMPETMGSGALFFDYNNDGWVDIYLVNGGSLVDPQLSRRARSALYRNNGDGTFT